MSTQILVNGKIREIPDADTTFTRALLVAGTRSTTREQRARLHLGTQVKTPGTGGLAHHVICSVSTDKLSWRDEDGNEHLTCTILI